MLLLLPLSTVVDALRARFRAVIGREEGGTSSKTVDGSSKRSTGPTDRTKIGDRSKLSSNSLAAVSRETGEMVGKEA